jgi:hypothetical protein
MDLEVKRGIDKHLPGIESRSFHPQPVDLSCYILPSAAINGIINMAQHNVNSTLLTPPTHTHVYVSVHGKVAPLL